ncbi:MAG: hypothetical protein J6N53_11400 [Lachnospiraceae bacterium]|nr:hypothetical protein [Lachnospiraceae bacterium]MBP3296171.1 hypothetical protein [Lachnospiraceae bacterium]
MKLSFREKAAYGLGAVGKDMVYMLSASYILYYYQDLLGIKGFTDHQNEIVKSALNLMTQHW